MIRTYADSTYMRMSKKELLEFLRCAEHNQQAAENTLNQQAINIKQLLDEKDKQIQEIKIKNEAIRQGCITHSAHNIIVETEKKGLLKAVYNDIDNYLETIVHQDKEDSCPYFVEDCEVFDDSIACIFSKYGLEV